MVYSGKGLMQQIADTNKRCYYEPLTVKTLKKYITSINRHKLRDPWGRFRKIEHDIKNT